MLLLTYLDPDKQTYYERLGLAPDATARDVERAYRRLSKRAHPDAGGSRGAWNRLQEAYDTLRDEALRFAYDTLDMTPHQLKEATAVVVAMMVSGYEQGINNQRHMRKWIDSLVDENIKRQAAEATKAKGERERLYRVQGDIEPGNYVMRQVAERITERITAIDEALHMFAEREKELNRIRRLIPHLNMLNKEPAPVYSNTTTTYTTNHWTTR